MSRACISGLLVAALVALVAGCGTEAEEANPGPPLDHGSTTIATADEPQAPPTTVTSDDGQVTAAAAPVTVGAEVLARNGFAPLVDRRVGVILNQASTVGDAELLDVLVAEPSVDVVAAFGPEHGVRGGAPAGAAIADSIDPATGVPAYSLYGEQREPSATALADLDVLVFDLQDVGARPFTYISTMGLAMQAAAKAGITFIVLDRPNPLGGGRPSGWVLDSAFESFVGGYPIPMIHGLTTGELALAIKGEAWLDGLEALDLQVIPLEDWSRENRWLDVGRDWVAPSPSLPTWQAATAYPGTVLFEATTMSVGRGTSEPFTTVGAPWVDSDALAQRMNDLGLPGVRFEPVQIRPEASEAVPNPPFANEEIGGVRIVPIDSSFRPFETGVHLLVESRIHGEQQGGGELLARPDFLDLLAGTDALRLGLTEGHSGATLIADWSDELAGFETARVNYLLYS